MAGRRISRGKGAAVADERRVRPGGAATIAALARPHAEAALAALVEVMGDRSATPAARISAAGAVLNWGFGKAAGATEEGRGGPEELTIRWLTTQEADRERAARNSKA